MTSSAKSNNYKAMPFTFLKGDFPMRSISISLEKNGEQVFIGKISGYSSTNASFSYNVVSKRINETFYARRSMLL